MIATYVSSQNDCHFCQSAHGAAAAHYLGGNEKLVSEIKLNFEGAAISDKLKALLAIAGKVQKGGKLVSSEDVDRARKQGATDKEIARHRFDRSRILHVPTVTSMASRRGPPRIRICIARTESGWLRMATSRRPKVSWVPTAPDARRRPELRLHLPIGSSVDPPPRSADSSSIHISR